MTTLDIILENVHSLWGNREVVDETYNPFSQDLSPLNYLPKTTKEALYRFRQLISNLENPQFAKNLGSGVLIPRSFIFKGESGTGKKEAAKVLAKSLGYHFHSLSHSGKAEDIMAKTQLAFEEAKYKKQGTFIYISDIDTYLTKPGSMTLVRSIANLKDTDKVYIIGSNRSSSMEEYLQKLLCAFSQVTFEKLDSQDQKKLFNNYQKQFKMEDSCLDAFVSPEACSFSDLNRRCQVAAYKALERGAKQIEVGDFTAMEKQVSSFKYLVKANEKTLEDLGGLPIETKSLLQDFKSQLKDRELLKKFGKQLSKGMIFYGPPGTGKTTIAHALANELGYNFYKCTGVDFQKKYYGEGPEEIQEMFEHAKANGPSIIFVDECEGLLGNRENSHNGIYMGLVTNKFMEQMDNLSDEHQVFVIAATNFLDRLDSASIRPGRFDQKIHFPLPNRREREEIFEVLKKRFPLHPSCKNLLRKLKICQGQTLV